jgi:outer membrane protein OmpA-like peptidoglycan-associated protein
MDSDQFPEQKIEKDRNTEQERGKAKSEDWNEAASRRPEISAAERAERQRVEGVGEVTIGCPFDKPPTENAVDEWYAKASKEVKAALKDPNSELQITGISSKTGERQYNLNLSRHRAETVAEILKEKYDVKARITATGQGYKTDMASYWPGKDSASQRLVFIDVMKSDGKSLLFETAGEEKGSEKQPPMAERAVKDLTEPPAKSKGYDFEKEVHDRLYSRAR